MAKSLQEQLLEAGALKKDRATKLKKEKHKQAKQRLRGSGDPDDVKLSAQQAQGEKAERDRALSRQRQLELEERAIAAQVRQLIEANCVDYGDGDIGYNFSVAGVIKAIHVSPHQHLALSNGHLALAATDDKYFLIPAPVADKINQRLPAAIVVLHRPDARTPSADDPYADYQIPDDLTW